jgi:arylsulfatase A-like enzyme
MIGDSDYRSAYMGKWHLGDELLAQHEFEEWVSIMDNYKNFGGVRRRKGVSDYNLRSDPHEEHNLYDSRDHEDVITRLTAEINRWQGTVGDNLNI